MCWIGIRRVSRQVSIILSKLCLLCKTTCPWERQLSMFWSSYDQETPLGIYTGLGQTYQSAAPRSLLLHCIAWVLPPPLIFTGPGADATGADLESPLAQHVDQILAGRPIWSPALLLETVNARLASAAAAASRTQQAAPSAPAADSAKRCSVAELESVLRTRCYQFTSGRCLAGGQGRAGLCLSHPRRAPSGCCSGVGSAGALRCWLWGFRAG